MSQPTGVYTDEQGRRRPLTPPQGQPMQEPTMQIYRMQNVVQRGDSTFFPKDGRLEEEIKEMTEYKYDELPVFRGKATATGGRNCGNCAAFESRPNTMPQNPTIFDGYCHKFRFRDRSYGCCDGWFPDKATSVI